MPTPWYKKYMKIESRHPREYVPYISGKFLPITLFGDQNKLVISHIMSKCCNQWKNSTKHYKHNYNNRSLQANYLLLILLRSIKVKRILKHCCWTHAVCRHWSAECTNKKLSMLISPYSCVVPHFISTL